MHAGRKSLHKIVDVQEIAARANNKDEGSMPGMVISEECRGGTSLNPERLSQEAGVMTIQAMLEQLVEQMDKNKDDLENKMGERIKWKNDSQI